jgi:hypothetical protein
MACNDLNQDGCNNTVGPDYNLDSNNTTSPNQSCVPTADGKSYQAVSNNDLRCKPFQLANGSANQYVDSVVNEALNIGGANLNVYKLLGVHEQGKLVDCTGKGNPLSNGDLPNFPASNAFDKYISEWRSVQKGTAVTASAYIGYDFGYIKTNDDSRRAYGIDTSVYKHITAIAIKQSSNPNRRVTKARLERSDDGIKWYGVGVVLLPDDDCFNTILTKTSVPARYWRLRALEFNGSETGDPWAVMALQLFHNYMATEQYNIQDKVFLENRDRDYDTDPTPMKGYYDLTDALTELSILGIETPSLMLYLKVSFSACVAAIGRPLVIGDIIEIPSEAQYSAEMKRILKWMEVTDVAWATEGYTPGWQPTLLRVVVQPAFASQETQDIFGDLAETSPDALGVVSGEDGQNEVYQDYFDVSKTVEAEARDALPERGAEGSAAIREWEPEEIQAAVDQGLPNLQKTGLNPTGLYVEDAMPPNNAPFTEGDEYPENPSHGDYHRLTYTGLAGDIPARLYRYSSAKGRWVYLETDMRAAYNPAKPVLEEFITSSNSVQNDKISWPRKTLDDQCEES